MRAANCPSSTAPTSAPRRGQHNHPVATAPKAPGKVAVFSTCYVNYNEPGIGHDLLKLLDHNEIPYRIVEKGETCCGMPKLELGDLETVEKYKERNIPLMHQLAAGATPSSRRCRPAR
jgi:glycerol-3-phosphate dehydrogenase subunit C